MKDTKSAKLNPEQQRAVDISSGPALVVAGAGTGKTRVIVERVARLISEGVNPKSIVALTFTEKAATEMADRINELRGGFNFDLRVMTYNAYGEQLLRRFAADIGMNSQFKLMEETAQLVFLREHLSELELDYYAPLTNPDGHLKELAAYFSRLKQNVVEPEAYRRWADQLKAGDKAASLEKQRHQELAGAYQRYMELCRRANVIDYDDQIYLVLQLFKLRPNVVKKVQNEVAYLLVDEFQDTNAMQSDLLDALAEPQKNIMVVGDDDQSIYGWRGATLDNILSFKSRYPKAKEIVLTENYRSGQAILDASYKLIKHNDPHRLEAQHGFNKRLKAKSQGKPPRFEYFATLSDELEFIASDIKHRIQRGQNPGSIAILARGHTTIGRAHNYLDAAGIEHNVAGIGYDLYLQPVITDLLFVLKAVADPTDNPSVYQALISFIFDDVGPSRLSELSGQANRGHHNLLDLALESEDETLKAAAEKISQWHEASGSRPVSQTLFDIFKSGVEPWLDKLPKTPEGEAQAIQATRDIKELFEIMRDFERVAVRLTVRGFIDNIEALKAAGQNVADDSYLITSEAVSLLTIHKAKGLEWDTVYILNLTQSSFPGPERANGWEVPSKLSRHDEADDHLLEERRLMYVAMTRAAKELIITASERLRYGGSRQRLSQFIEEIFGQQELEAAALGKSRPLETILPPVTIETGDKTLLPPSMFKNGQLLLSASHIETYVFCPLNFYYKYVLNWPEEDSKEAAIGRAFHAVAAQINQNLFDGQAVTIQQAMDMLESFWPQHGFKSAAERQKELKRAQAPLGEYLKREQAASLHPDLVEENFHFELGGGVVRVSGRFDAVYSRSPVEIRDYKTTQVTDQESADKKAAKSYQLGIYALAWQQSRGEIPGSLTLDFITSGLVGRSVRSQRQIDNTEKKILEIAKSIRKAEFPPKGQHDLCVHPSLD